MMGDRTRRAREATPSALLALLLIGSIFAPFATGLVGLANAQTYEKTVTGAPEFVVMDTTGLDAGTITLEVEISQAPGGGSDIIYREERTVANLPDELAFRNAGAYENVTFRVSGASSEPDIGSGSDFKTTTWTTASTFLVTGGDRDYQCGLDGRLASAVNPTYQSSDCYYTLPGTTSVNTTGLDANETKLEIYQSAATQADSAESYHTMLNNRLQDTETVALTKGKGAYIRTLNNGEGKTAAKAGATNNVSEYYSVMEYNLIQKWNQQISQMKYLRNLAQSETGVSERSIFMPIDNNPDFYSQINITGYGTQNYQLQNGTTVEVTTIEAQSYDEGNDGTPVSETIQITTGEMNHTEFGDYTNRNGTPNVSVVAAREPPSLEGEGDYEVIELQEFADHMAAMQSQGDSARDQMSTVVNQTHDQYKAGEINSSDLVDPYVLQNQFSPGDEYQGWSAATLAMLGTNQPTDLDQTGYMKVNVSGGETVKGVLQAGGNPPGGEFVVGETYDPANVTGSVFVTTDSKVKEITSPFTLENATTYDGQTRTNVTIEKKTYETTSADDLKALNEELSLLREEISAREDNLNSAAGGAGFLGGGNSTVILALVAAAFVALMAANGGRR